MLTILNNMGKGEMETGSSASEGFLKIQNEEKN